MMSQIVPWNRDASRDDLDRAAQILRDGGLVGFPTETGYAVAAEALQLEAVRLLAKHNELLPLLLPAPVKFDEWLPDISPLGSRLARKLWPGPAILVGADGVDRGRANDFPDQIRDLLRLDEALAFRSSIHEVAWELAAHPNPLVAADLGPDRKTAESVAAAIEDWGDNAGLIFDGGESDAKSGPTVVKLSGANYSVEEANAIAGDAVDDAARCRIMLVCTGNTCRSPMAEAFFRNELATLLECSPDDLADQGFIVQSAGLNATAGSPATAESAKIAEEFGADLSGHQSRLLTLELLLQSDYLFAMTQTHLAVLQTNLFNEGAFCGLLSEGEIPDPFGAAEEVYRECAEHILQCVKKWAPRIQQEEAAVQSHTVGRRDG